MNAPTAVEFWFEFASTYSYPASQRIETAARERCVPLVWRAFLLGPIFRDQGWNDSPFNIYPAKGRYMWRDLQRICASLDLPLQQPSQFPRSGLLAARVVSRFATEPWLPAFVRAVYRANFSEDRDISNREVIADCIAAASGPAEHAIAEAQSDASKEALRRTSEEARERGVFGAPSFLVGDELFWGNDRLEDALDWYAAHQPSAGR